jgi:predicted Zn-dependent peptidase
MELKTYRLSGSAVLDHIRTDSFKKARLSVTLTLPADSNDLAAMSLVLPISMRATEKYGDFATLCRRCDDLYAADIGDTGAIRGKYTVLGLRAAMLCNRYVTDADRENGVDITDGVMELMSQILLHPQLLERDIENEKANQINRIKARVNDSFGFAVRRLREVMQKGEPCIMEAHESISRIEKLTRDSLEEYRSRLLRGARVEFFYCGPESQERISELIEKHFAPLLESDAGELPIPDARTAGNEKSVAEEGEYTQSNLLLGFCTGVRLNDPEFYSAELMNEIYGEGSTSKLFLNVREKRSLCYFCASDYDEVTGILTVGCGIDDAAKDEAMTEILAQLAEMARGNISDSELDTAKQSIYSDCREAEDHPEDYEEFSRMARTFGGPATIEEYREGIAGVTVEQIADVAQKTRLDTVYFLRGTLEGEDEE